MFLGYSVSACLHTSPYPYFHKNTELTCLIRFVIFYGCSNVLWQISPAGYNGLTEELWMIYLWNYRYLKQRSITNLCCLWSEYLHILLKGCWTLLQLLLACDTSSWSCIVCHITIVNGLRCICLLAPLWCCSYLLDILLDDVANTQWHFANNIVLTFHLIYTICK